MSATDSQQPGQTVSPTGSGPAEPPQTFEAPQPPKASAPDPPATAEPPDEPAVSGPPQVGDQLFSPEADETDEVEPPERADPQAITWTASEFIAHEKSFGWYAALAAGAAVFAALVYLVSRDFVSVAVVLVAALLLGIYGSHKPKQLEYRLDSGGLTIGPKRFRYNEFRSFSVMAEGAFSSIVFMPLRRFAVATTIYYPPEAEEKIVSVLAGHLPLEERTHDAVDRLMHRIRY